MKLIAIMILLAVVILVVVGYDLLMKAATRKTKNSINQMNDTIDNFQKEIDEMSKLKTKINETESTNLKQSKKSKSK
jgi:Sec-independent protein translocase protein TatA